MASEMVTSGVVQQRPPDNEFDAFLARVQERFIRNTDNGKKPVFTTANNTLFETYLAYIDPPGERQYHNCHACKSFFNRYAGLVTIDEKGHTRSAVWDIEDAPDFYKPAVRALLVALQHTHVEGVFYSDLHDWGTPLNGTDTKRWTHFALTPPSAYVNKSRAKTAGQLMAEKAHDRQTLAFALQQYSPELLGQAITLLKGEALYRSEKVLGVAEFLHNTMERWKAAKGSEAKKNVLWLAAATAAPGFCHPRSSMIGTLLDDLSAGLSMSTVQQRFAEKMHPLQYQRPQAAPKAGNITASEKLVEKLGIARSLERRYAKLEHLLPLWCPRPAVPPVGEGVFKNVVPRGRTTVERPVSGKATTMTFVKFKDTVLPTAESMELLVPLRGNFLAFTTAVHLDAPPILQWDLEEARNPVSWYLYSGGSHASQWALRAGDWHEVTAITVMPPHWFFPERFKHHDQRANFILKGAADISAAGLCLFPEILKSELHEARATIEAFSSHGKLAGREEASACGLCLGGNSRSMDPVHVRVMSKGVQLEYKLDRWD